MRIDGELMEIWLNEVCDRLNEVCDRLNEVCDTRSKTLIMVVFEILVI